MNVAISIEDLRAQRVWYDASTGKLFIQAKVALSRRILVFEIAPTARPE